MTEKNGKIFKYIGIGLATILVTIGVAWGALRTDLSHTKDRVEEVRTENMDKNALQDMQIQFNKEQSIRSEEAFKALDKNVTEGFERIERALK